MENVHKRWLVLPINLFILSPQTHCPACNPKSPRFHALATLRCRRPGQVCLLCHSDGVRFRFPLFGGFLENENSLETLIVIFENVSPKGSSDWKWSISKFQFWRRIHDIYRQQLLTERETIQANNFDRVEDFLCWTIWMGSIAHLPRKKTSRTIIKVRFTLHLAVRELN